MASRDANRGRAGYCYRDVAAAAAAAGLSPEAVAGAGEVLAAAACEFTPDMVGAAIDVYGAGRKLGGKRLAPLCAASARTLNRWFGEPRFLKNPNNAALVCLAIARAAELDGETDVTPVLIAERLAKGARDAHARAERAAVRWAETADRAEVTASIMEHCEALSIEGLLALEHVAELLAR